jgi:hypothetical protein
MLEYIYDTRVNLLASSSLPRCSRCHKSLDVFRGAYIPEGVEIVCQDCDVTSKPRTDSKTSLPVIKVIISERTVLRGKIAG